MRLYTVTDASKYLGITRKGVTSALLRGRIKPTIRTVGGTALFDEDALDKYRDNHLGRIGRQSVVMGG